MNKLNILNSIKVFIISLFVISMSGITAYAFEIKSHNSNEGIISKKILIEPATRYVFSDQYKAKETSEIFIKYTLNDESNLTVRVEQFPSSKKWAVAEINFATPVNAKSMIIGHRIFQGRHMQAKNFNLEKQ